MGLPPRESKSPPYERHPRSFARMGRRSGAGGFPMKMNIKKRHVLFAFCFAAIGLVMLRPAAAATGFEKLPGEQGKTSPLVMRVVQYDGSTNGAITVEVKNPTGQSQEFSAK